MAFRGSWLMYKPESVIICFLLAFIFFCLYPISKANIVMVILLLKRLRQSIERRVISLTHPVYTFDHQSAALNRLIPIVSVGVKKLCLLLDVQYV